MITEKLFIVDLQPVGRRAEVRPGQTLLEAAQSAGVELVSICGGIGVCDGCRVRLAAGQLTPLSLEEEMAFAGDELAAGYRLACQASPLSDVTIDIPPESLTTLQRLQIEGAQVEVELAPAVIGLDLQLEPPSLDDLRSDSARLKDSLKGRLPYHTLSLGYPLLSGLSPQLRQQKWALRAVMRGDEGIAALPPGERLVGLAVDVGTTKLASYLIDLESGATLAKTGAMNPQISYGEDVVSRIAYANNRPHDGPGILHNRLLETLNDMIGEMCVQASLRRSTIVDAVVVGNTAMHHFFAGLPVAQLGASPYVPAVSEALDLPAHLLGLDIAPGANVHLPPNIAGYVGSDHVAMLLATRVWESGGAALALDIGTNTEISLAPGKKAGWPAGRLLSSSCASGPAFEGAHIHDGMRAAPGAVEKVQIDGDQVRVYTIHDQPAVGICGSGILDAIAQMQLAGIIDQRGVFNRGHPQVRVSDSRREFVLVPASESGHGRDVCVTRQDVNEIQLAKGAIRAAIEIMLAEAGLQAADLDQVIVAGAFGTYINLKSAIQVGMLPPLPLGRFSQVGNAAGAGARQMLVSLQQRELAGEIVRRVDYLELSAHRAFTTQFARALILGDIS